MRGEMSGFLFSYVTMFALRDGMPLLFRRTGTRESEVGLVFTSGAKYVTLVCVLYLYCSAMQDVTTPDTHMIMNEYFQLLSSICS